MAKYYPEFYMTDYPVGEGERNDSLDVKLLQIMFIELRRVAPNTWANLGTLTGDGRWSNELKEHIRNFQSAQYGGHRLVVDGKIHPMRMQRSDLRATFRSGVGSTLYALNIACMANVPRAHSQIAQRLNLRAITDTT